MKLHELITRVSGKILHQGCCAEKDIDRFYAGDKMSDLLNQASDNTLIVTNLVNAQLLRFADLMDVPGICLLNNVTLTDEMTTMIHEHETTILVSAESMEETCQRLRQCLSEAGA